MACLRLHADLTASHHAFADKLASNVLCDVDRNCKAQALGRRNRGRVYPDYFTTRIYKWAAGIAGIQRNSILAFDGYPMLSDSSLYVRSHSLGD
jgi:hypothetical protein